MIHHSTHRFVCILSALCNNQYLKKKPVTTIKNPKEKIVCTQATFGNVCMNRKIFEVRISILRCFFFILCFGGWELQIHNIYLIAKSHVTQTAMCLYILCVFVVHFEYGYKITTYIIKSNNRYINYT